ncbi:adenine deaminase domain protein, partial [Shigella flexneri 1235-66]
MNNQSRAKSYQLSRDELQNILAVARGDAPADYMIDHVTVLDLINGGMLPGPIVISGKSIAGIGPAYQDAPARQRIDA